MFYLGGILPLVISLFLIVLLPESIQFLAVRGEVSQRIHRILARISPEFGTADVSLPSSSRKERHKDIPVKRLFTEGRAAGTILLWLPYFMNLLLIYFTGSWLPALLKQEGMSVSAASTATAFISLGGVFGCVVEGHLIKWRGSGAILFAEYAVAGLFLALLAMMSVPYFVVLLFTFTVGFMIIGAQGGLNALAASFYPTSMRSTGVGWALGIGRIGSIIGPLLGGMFLSFGWKPGQMLLFGTVVAVSACLSILVGNFWRGHTTVYSREPSLDQFES
jgi:AAHS family 4-hydroxybenzoate transporter-like MFS transporter